MTKYQQSANPNATNSEQDAKQIITHKELNSRQRDELIDRYCEIVVDSMDMKSLMIYAIEQMSNYMDKLSDSELKEEVDNYDSELFDELIDNIKSDYCEGEFIPNFHD